MGFDALIVCCDYVSGLNMSSARVCWLADSRALIWAWYVLGFGFMVTGSCLQVV